MGNHPDTDDFTRRCSGARITALCRTLMLAVLTFASLPLAGAEAGDIYKYRDKQGELVYTDQPPAVPSERVSVDPKPKENDSERAKRQEQKATFEKMASDHLTRDREQAAVKADKDAERTKRCQAARVEVARVTAGARLVDIDANGNRRYLSSQEIDRRRDAAQRAVQSNCASTP